jgi:hypothetical protein
MQRVRGGPSGRGGVERQRPASTYQTTPSCGSQSGSDQEAQTNFGQVCLDKQTHMCYTAASLAKLHSDNRRPDQRQRLPLGGSHRRSEAYGPPFRTFAKNSGPYAADSPPKSAFFIRGTRYRIIVFPEDILAIMSLDLPILLFCGSYSSATAALHPAVIFLHHSCPRRRTTGACRLAGGTYALCQIVSALPRIRSVGAGRLRCSSPGFQYGEPDRPICGLPKRQQ